MKQDSSTQCWNNISEEWCEIAPENDTRKHFIMPYMLRLMGDVKGKKILDLGCGEGGYARALADKGADLVGIDCAEYSIEHAKRCSEPGDITYYVRNSNDLYGIEDDHFDIVLCSMMLMDCEDLEGTLKEISRVLKQNGKVYASVLHPCFTGGKIGRQGHGLERKVIVEDYFSPSIYTQSLPESKNEVVWRHRTIEEYVKLFVKNGLNIIDLNEARPGMEATSKSVLIQWLNKIPLFLYWVLEKQ